MSRFVLILMISLIACEGSREDLSQAIFIPDLEIDESDERLELSRRGILSLDSVPFSGYLIRHYPNGQLKSRKGYFEGKQEGDAWIYYADGKVYSQRPYRNGEKHGEHLAYYPNGQKKFQYYFVNGLGEGTHLEWYEDGSPRREMNYKDGKEFGAQKMWRTDGKIRSNYVVRENGRQYGMLGLKRCTKIDSETGDIEPYQGEM